MRTERDLAERLRAIDRRGYPAYKSLRGVYDLGGLELSVDHVQGDPFAAPSQVSVMLPAARAGFPGELFDAPHRRVALEDLLVRRFARAAARVSFAVGGSGKSGLIATSRPGPEVLPRSACSVGADGSVTLRLEAGLPAHGRTVDGRAAARMLLDLIPSCAEEALVCTPRVGREARAAADLADDRRFVREELVRRGLVAFVADGSVLPRESGVSSRPMEGARPFTSPESMRVVLDLPHRGPTPGMGVRRGVTLIVGGGYHGKSTLLRALQEGVYDHVAGDGRELVVTDAAAVKLRAEEAARSGRRTSPCSSASCPTAATPRASRPPTPAAARPRRLPSWRRSMRGRACCWSTRTPPRRTSWCATPSWRRSCRVGTSPSPPSWSACATCGSARG